MSSASFASFVPNSPACSAGQNGLLDFVRLYGFRRVVGDGGGGDKYIRIREMSLTRIQHLLRCLYAHQLYVAGGCRVMGVACRGRRSASGRVAVAKPLTSTTFAPRLAASWARA